MFTIIGGDGKEYGPVTTEQVRTWITSGRASLETKAKAVGSDEWRKVGDFAEFSASTGMAPVIGAAAAPTDQVELAGRGSRLLAVLVDGVIGILCAVPGVVLIGPQFIQVVLDASHGEQPDFSGMNLGEMLVGMCVLAFVLFALAIVQIVLLSMRGQTIGKILLKIRVVKLDGSKAGFLYAWLLRAFVNGIITAIPWLGTLYALVDICFIFREDRRCIHDLIASTKVVKVVPTT